MKVAQDQARQPRRKDNINLHVNSNNINSSNLSSNIDSSDINSNNINSSNSNSDSKSGERRRIVRRPPEGGIGNPKGRDPENMLQLSDLKSDL